MLNDVIEIEKKKLKEQKNTIIVNNIFLKMSKVKSLSFFLNFKSHLFFLKKKIIFFTNEHEY
jgi:hypothetical protein